MEPLPLLLILVILATAAADLTMSASSSCRCLAGESCFPPQEHWGELEQRLQGRLLQVHPTAFPCYNSTTNSSCNEVRSNWENSLWRSTIPGATEHPNFERYRDEGCPLPTNDSVNGCYQGSVPVYAVEALCTKDVQEAVRFAKQHNLRLVVKNTGHDYLGRSSGRGSLSIWTHNLKNISFSRRKMDASVSINTSSVTIGAGVQTQELMRAADQAGVVFVGPLSASVGVAGGYFQGGGHSPLSPFFGLAADNVVEFEIVTPDGSVRVANRNSHADLFWAVRGGGGGTFGVVVSATLRTYAAPQSLLAANYIISCATTAALELLLQTFASMSPNLTDDGWAGYFTIVYTPVQALILRYIALNREPGYASRSFAPLLQHLNASSPSSCTLQVSQEGAYTAYLRWYEDALCSFYASNACIDQVGINRGLTGRLVARAALENRPAELVAALVSILSSRFSTGLVLGMHLGGGAAARTDVDNAVNAAWRETLWHITAEAQWGDAAAYAQVAAALTGLSDSNSALRALTPGAYLNEHDLLEPEWKASLFGDKYDRLLSIKRIVDPTNLLSCHHCVGSDQVSGCSA